MSIDIAGGGADQSDQNETDYRRRVFQPAFQVRLTSHRDGMPYHSIFNLDNDILSLETSKSITSPAGTWSLTLTPARKLGAARGRTWAEIVEPMDYVEIDLRTRARDPWTTVMRGFVDNVRMVDAVNPQDGLPRRRVVLNGRDYGKLWLIYKVFYLLELKQVPFGDLAATMLRYWGIEPGNVTPTVFFATIFDKLLHPKFARLRARNRNVREPTLYCQVPDQFRVDLFSSTFQSFTGPLWNLMDLYASAPYTEFLIRDLPGVKEPEFLWRWAPLLTRGNKLALPYTPLPPTHNLHASLITNYDVGTSDNDRYTYFWAQPGQYSGSAISSVSKIDHPGYIDAAGIDLYGYNPYEPPFNMYHWYDDTDRAAAPTVTQQLWGPQVTTLTNWLADTMLWAVEQYEGNIQAHLDPRVVIGDYLRVVEEARLFYVEQVSHSIVVGRSATTVFGVTRGLTLDDPSIIKPRSFTIDDVRQDGSNIPGGSIAIGPDNPVPVGQEPIVGPPPPSSGRQGVVDVGMALRGNRYALGTRAYLVGMHAGGYAEGLAAIRRSGIDCSEFVDWCYYWGLGGTRVLPTAQSQYNRTFRVDRTQLVPGDIVFFENTVPPEQNNYDRISHSGIYVGGGKMINAMSEAYGVDLASIDDQYWGPKFVSGGRVWSREPAQPGGGGNRS